MKFARLAVFMCIATALAVAAAPAGSIVPPTDCGMQSVKGKRYQIKADQLRCTTAKRHSRRYLSERTRPSGYRCRNYGSETKLKFRCSKGIHVFFAIKR